MTTTMKITKKQLRLNHAKLVSEHAENGVQWVELETRANEFWEKWSEQYGSFEPQDWHPYEEEYNYDEVELGQKIDYKISRNKIGRFVGWG